MSRIGTSICLLCLTLASFPVSRGQGPRAERGEPVPKDPVEAILRAFDHFPIVALGEGGHTNWQGATFRLRLLRDPRFAEKVDDILVECGTGRYQDVMDRYIAGDVVPMDSVRLCWRETTQPLIWDTPIYAEFFAAVRTLNQSLPHETRLRVLLGDPPINWSRIRTREQLEQWYYDHARQRPWGTVNARDGHAVDVLEREVLAKGRRVLAIYGDMHFARPEFPMGGFFGDYFKGNIVQQIERLHPGSIYTVTTLTDTDSLQARFPAVQSWPRPCLVNLGETSLGALVLRGSIPLEQWHDALLWLGPGATIGYSALLPEVVADQSYYEESLRRDRLWIGQYQDELTDLRRRYVEGLTN